MFGMFAPVVSSGVMNSSKHQRGPSSSITASGVLASSSRTRRVLVSVSTTIPVSSLLSVISCAIASLAAGVFGRLRMASFWLVPSTMQQNPLTLPEYPVTRYFMFPSFPQYMLLHDKDYNGCWVLVDVVFGFPYVGFEVGWSLVFIFG